MLMKQCLSFALWEEPYVGLEAVIMNYTRPKRVLLRALTAALRLLDLRLVQGEGCTRESRAQGRVWPTYADTMIGMPRLDNLQFCVESALREGIPGDLAEAGVWRGGAAILMRAVLAAHEVEDRRVIAADSFQGLPRPDAERAPQDAGDVHYRFPYLAVSRPEVEANFRKYGLLDDQVVFVEGWFRESLPEAPVDRLAVLRVDADMYGSTMDVLTNWYGKVSKGGFVVIDDYNALRTCKDAVDDFRAAEGVQAALTEIDWSGVFWRKE
jgi:hypothetical protein